MPSSGISNGTGVLLDLGAIAEVVGEDVRGETIDGETMPEPYRALLVHDRDMTSTLEDFFKVSLELEVLGKIEMKETMTRRVLLVAKEDGRVVEFGAIRIALGVLPAGACEDVCACEKPLGAILHEHGVGFTSSPTAFYRVADGAELPAKIRKAGARFYYARRNTLRLVDGDVIAEIVEVLPSI